MVLMDHTGWKLRKKQCTGTTDQLIEDLEAAYDNAPNMFSIRIHHGGKFHRYPGRMYVSGRVDIFDMVDIDLFTVVALNMMVLTLGYTVKSEPMFYNYIRPLTSLDEGLYALAYEEDVCCLATLVRSFKLIEVYIEHGVTAFDSYLRAPRLRETLEVITDEPGSIAANRTEKMLLLTWHESSETSKEHVCDSVTPSSLPQHDSSTPCKDSVRESITPRCMPDCILTTPTDESVITYTQLSGVQGVDTQRHVIDDVMRQLSFDETESDGEIGFANIAGSGVDSSGLSRDKYFGVDDLDLNLNEHVSTQEPIMAEVCTEVPIVEEVGTKEFSMEDVPLKTYCGEVRLQEVPIVAKVCTEVPIVEEVGTKEFSMEDVILKDYVSSGEDVEQDTTYETEYDVRSSEDACTNDDDDVNKDFLVDEENEIVEPDVDVHLFGISIDLPFDNIGVTNLVLDDVLEGEDVDVINADGFNSDPGNDEEKNYRKRRLAKLRTEMEDAKDRVYLHPIESRRNLKLYKNDGVRIRARCDGKVLVFTMSQGTGPTGPNCGMKAGPSGSSGLTTRSKKRKNTGTNDDSLASSSVLDTHDKGDLYPWVLVNLDIPVKAVQDQLQRELEVQISMSKAFKAKAKAEKEINGDHVLQYSILRDCVVELQSTNPNTTIKIGAIKTGFKSLQNRDLLGLDGLSEGHFPSQVLVACLGDDIDRHPNSNFTFISGRQKGIIPAIKTVYPTASTINLRDFKKCILELKIMNPKAHEWLNKIPAEYWARSYFSGRAKLIYCSTTSVREYCMKRIMNVQGVIDKCTSPLTPTATRIMESIKKEAHLMKVQWNGANKYQVSGSLGDQCVVDVYMKGNILSQDTTNLWDQVLGEVHMSNNTFATQASCPVGQDGSGGSGAGAIMGLFVAAGEGGAGGLGVSSQGSSHMSETRNADGREMGDGVPTQSSAVGGASIFSVIPITNLF
ncbi:hypothetical protein Tco_0716669 [Tanacetum coccineum]